MKINVFDAPLYRLLLATPAAFAIAFAIAGSWRTALYIALADGVAKTILWFLYRRFHAKSSGNTTGHHTLDSAPVSGQKDMPARVIWFTGLSGAGKTTIAKLVHAALLERGIRAEWLDGDVTRAVLPQTGFTRPERNAHVTKAGFIATMLERNNVFVVASYISPYRESREKVRGMCANFFEVHVSTPLEECERRDVKGLYAKARAGEIKLFTGIDDPYEEPENPEARVNTVGRTPEACRDDVLAALGL